MSERKKIIKFVNVSKSYGPVIALKNINFTVQEHDFVTIIGSSGCGKTTLLKSVNALLTPEEGEIYIEGKNIRETDSISLRRNIGYVIQDIGLFPHMNVKKNIAYVPHIKGISKIEKEKIIKGAVKAVQLDEALLKRYPKELSGGQKQRVGLARALAAQTNILLMDEPFGAVDEITRRTLQEEILDIYKKSNLTILFVTHDIREAFNLGTKIVIMDRGEIIQYGKTEKVKLEPRNNYVRDLIGM